MEPPHRGPAACPAAIRTSPGPVPPGRSAISVTHARTRGVPSGSRSGAETGRPPPLPAVGRRRPRPATRPARAPPAAAEHLRLDAGPGEARRLTGLVPEPERPFRVAGVTRAHPAPAILCPRRRTREKALDDGTGARRSRQGGRSRRRPGPRRRARRPTARHRLGAHPHARLPAEGTRVLDPDRSRSARSSGRPSRRCRCRSPLTPCPAPLSGSAARSGENTVGPRE